MMEEASDQRKSQEQTLGSNPPDVKSSGPISTDLYIMSFQISVVWNKYPINT